MHAVVSDPKTRICGKHCLKKFVQNLSDRLVRLLHPPTVINYHYITIAITESIHLWLQGTIHNSFSVAIEAHFLPSSMELLFMLRVGPVGPVGPMAISSVPRIPWYPMAYGWYHPLPCLNCHVAMEIPWKFGTFSPFSHQVLRASDSDSAPTFTAE